MTKNKESSNSSPTQIPLFQGIDENNINIVETLSEEQAEKYSFDVVNYGDSNRPKTCLEIDFPILKVNEISTIESNVYKPTYMMSKWWARRRPSVFRQLLISAATKCPQDETLAAQTSWSLMYRKNHKRHGKFSKLKIVDPFMGGGTTVVEASRLGFDVTGVDLNPIAWWIVKNEITPVPSNKIEELAEYVEMIVKPQIMPFFSSRSTRGFTGCWIDTTTNKATDIDPSSLPPTERSNFRWEGPEIIYTFWIKHIMCSDPACYHLTPQIKTAIVAEKKLKIKHYSNCVCPTCGEIFDLEIGNFRMAPTSEFILGVHETPYATIIPNSPNSQCPHCNCKLDTEWIGNQEIRKGKPKSKDVTHYLLLSKDWLKGISAKSKDYYGGYYGSTLEQDALWFEDRFQNINLIEVRGEVPKNLEHSNFGTKMPSSDSDDMASSGQLVCGKCKRHQDPLSSIKLTGHLAPIIPYLVQGYDKKARDYSYNGRFFDIPDWKQILNSFREYLSRDDLHQYVPQEELFYGFQTHHLQGGVPNHGYTHWYKMFNPRQLYINALLMKTISEAPESRFDRQTKSQVLGALQNYLRHNCMFTIWNISGDKLEPQFANNNYHPKATAVENSVFSELGRGNFKSCIESVVAGMNFAFNPYDLIVNTSDKGGKSNKVESKDQITGEKVRLICGSATDLKKDIPDNTIDMVITDPPFGDNLNYSELADFFLVWLRKPLQMLFPEDFKSPESPKTLEVVANKARHPGESEDGKRKADIVYDRLLTMCWKEAHRMLKPGGLMAFTFHHDKDIAWIGVLDSLFKAGFIIESTFPIRSDSTKGDGDFGSKKIEYDIVHVCRKLLIDTQEIYWATLRRRIIDSVKSRSSLLAQHKASGLHIADLEVIIRGEVLEQYSKHYGKVRKNLVGDLMSVREILLEANSIAQGMLQISNHDRIPDDVDPETRIFFNLFRDGPSIEFGAARKRLKGSGTSLEEMEALGWLAIHREGSERIAKIIPLGERWNSLSRKKTLVSDLDQAYFIVNCCFGSRTYKDKPADLEGWILENYKSLMLSVQPILGFIENNHFGSDYKQAIGIASRTLDRTLQKVKDSDGELNTFLNQLNLFNG